MHVIAIANQKGGVGKTTTVVNLAAGLAAAGKRVLVVDMDAQGHSTLALLAGAPQRSMAHVLVGQCALADIVAESTTPGVWIAPGDYELAGADLWLVTRTARENVLKRALDALAPQFDIALIDTSPALGMLTVNSLVAARHVLVPVSPEFYSLAGLQQLLRTIGDLRSGIGCPTDVLGFLLTVYDKRNGITAQVSSQLLSAFGPQVFDTRIRFNANLKEHVAHKQNIFQFEGALRKPRKGADDYAALAAEVLARLSPASNQQSAA